MSINDYLCTDCANYDSCPTPQKVSRVWFCDTGNFRDLPPEERYLRD